MTVDDLPVPPQYAAVLAAGEELFRRYPNGVNTEVIGCVAWDSLTPEQQRVALPSILGVYVSRVHDEERSTLLETRAADTTHTYLDTDDVSGLWESVAARPDEFGDVEASRDALRNVLSELELLQHRLDMRDVELERARESTA